MSELADLVEGLGGRKATADALHMSLSSVHAWFTVPPGKREPTWATVELMRRMAAEKRQPDPPSCIPSPE